MDDKIEQLKATLPSIPEMAPGLVKETDSSLCGPCPMCGGTDRFVYKINEEKFWCRGCREKGGDVIDLYRMIHNKTLAELFTEFSINGNKRGLKPVLQLQPEKTEQPNKSNYSQQDRWNNLLDNTNTDPIIRLAKRRGISNETVLKAYNENKVRFTMHYLKDQEEVSSVACQYYELDGDKKVRAIQMLSVDGQSYSDTDNKNKVFTYGSENEEGCFFQVGENIEHAKIIILFESVINAFSCAEVFPSACSLAIGSSVYTKKVRVLRKYRDAGAQIICFFDNDKDGQKAVGAVSILLGGKTKAVKWPEGTPVKQDINDLLKAGKQKEIFDMINNSEFVKIDAAGTEEDANNQIDELNKIHAVVTISSKVSIVYEATDLKGRPDIKFLSKYDFEILYANRKIPNPMTGKGQPKTIPLSSAWLSSPKRREYQGVVFDPKNFSNDKFYNLYRGLACKPIRGDWSLFKSHIFENVCSGNLSNFNWLIAWMARIVQDPGGEKPGTAVVLRGDRGTGKNVFAEIFGRIFGHHFLQVTNSNQIMGRFNSHLIKCILLYMDEAWFAGDKSSEGVLKGLITSPEHMAEIKGKDAFSVDNYVNCIIASNNDWVVPVGNRERRFFMLDVSDAHIQDYEYFKAISDQMYKQDGTPAMLYDLLDVDISKFNLRKAPKTESLFDQRSQGLSSFEQFWFEKLSSSNDLGDFDSETGSSGVIFKSKFYDEYINYCDKMNIGRRESQRNFGKNLAKYCNFEVVRRVGNDQKQHWCYLFPEKNICKKQFEEQADMKITWEDFYTKNVKNEVDDI